MRLKDKIMVVTGGGQGIGQAAALRCSQEGAKVVIAGRTPETIQSVEKEIHELEGEALAIRCDVSKEEQVKRMVDLIDLYFSYGGHHLQINCQDRRVFMDAQKHPEKYPTLLVRVAGYNANFVELPKAVQDEIIERTPVSV